MCKQKGFLLIEALFSVSFLIVFMLIITYGMSVRSAWQLASIKRLHALQAAQATMEAAINTRDMVAPVLGNGLKAELQQTPCVVPREAQGTNTYQFKHRYLTVQWQTPTGKTETVKLYSGVWHV